MEAKGEAFARQLEAKAAEATTLLEGLTDADWKKTTAAETWTVAVTAHHIASSYESATRIIKTITSGQALPRFTPEMRDEMNARHAREFAGCTKPETIALHREGAAAAAVRGGGVSRSGGARAPHGDGAGSRCGAGVRGGAAPRR